jgi:hypothetical protein
VYREKKKNDQEFRRRHAEIQKAYRKRCKEHETPRDKRQRMKQKREYMREYQEKKKAMITVEIVDLDASHSNDIPLQLPIDSLVPNQNSTPLRTLNKIAVSAQKRERAKLKQKIACLQSENTRLKRRVLRISKQKLRSCNQVCISFSYLLGL